MLGGVLIREIRLDIDTKTLRWAGQVSGGVPVSWWCEPSGS